MKYVALLRGIGPSNPNMHGSKLKAVTESAGFSGVQTLLSSGNIIFEADSPNQTEIEAKLERAWPAKLGFNSMTIVRSQNQLQALINANPYKNAQHSRSSYLLVTFFKMPPSPRPSKNYYDVLGANALCNNLDNSGELGTPDFMAKLDKQFGKDQITSRTWLTVQRILAKMENS